MQFLFKYLPAVAGVPPAMERDLQIGDLAGLTKVEARREGCYANHLEVGHNAFEFVVDFGQSFEDERGPVIHTRIITSPEHFKLFVETMQKSFEQFESTIGPIGREGRDG